MSTPEIIDIYKKVEIKRDQAVQKMKDKMNNTLEGQLTRVFKSYFELLQNPKIPVALVDEAKRDMSKMLDVVRMDSDHDVIMALTDNILKKQYVEKLK